MDLRKLFSLVLLTFLSLTSLAQTSMGTLSGPTGLWLGVMEVSDQMSLQLAYEIEENAGSYSAKLNVVEQKAFDIPMDTCVIIEDSIFINFNAAGINYKGFYSSENDKIYGIYSQGGGSYALDMTRVDELPLEVERPQTPVRPFPYDEEEVVFENASAGINLAGTLTLPKGASGLTGIVLIAGSGPNDRNETAMGHFLLLSDFLTREGYAVLRYDKRGIGASEGDYGKATTFDFAEDAKAAVEYLKTRPDIDPSSIGLIGHSEGALIAPMIAAEKDSNLSFIVLMGGVGVSGSELLLLQVRRMSEISGAPDEEIEESIISSRVLYDIAKTNESDSVVGQKIKEADPDINEGLYNMLLSPWFRTFLSLEPGTWLEKVECPVLAITGEKDVQCPPVENLAAIEQSLQKGGNQNYSVQMLPGLNHLFQTAESGSPYEYEQIPEIISPDALEVIRIWLVEINARH